MSKADVGNARSSAESGNALQALAWMLGALASFSAVAVSGREAAAALTAAAGDQGFSGTLQLMFLRSIVGVLVVSLVLALSQRGFSQIRTPVLHIHGLRNGIHFIAQFSWFHALTLIPLAQLFAIEFTAPIWVALMAPFFLGERLTARRLLAALLGFVGILIVIRPFGDGGGALGLGSALALASAFGFAGSMVATKKMMRTDTALALLFHMSWMQFLVSGALALPTMILPPPPMFLFWAVVVGVTSLTAHFCLANAFSKADAMIVAPMDFLRLPLIAAIGALLYSERIDLAVFAGAGVIVAGNLINILGDSRQKPR